LSDRLSAQMHFLWMSRYTEFTTIFTIICNYLWDDARVPRHRYSVGWNYRREIAIKTADRQAGL